jgi:tetratricopeptide (TPR) repeat protein
MKITALMVLVLAGAFCVSGSARPDSMPAAPTVSGPAASAGAADTAAALPFGAGTSYLLGSSLMEEGRFQEALPYLHHAYSLAGDMPEIARAYLRVLLELGQAERGLQVVTVLLRDVPDDLDLGRQRVVLLAELGRWEEALRGLQEIEERGGRSADLYLLEGHILFSSGRLADATRVLKEALALGPERRENIYLLLADILAQSGPPEALDHLWREAVAALPQSDRVRFGFLRHLVQTGRIDEALDFAQSADAAATDRQEAAVPDEQPHLSWALELADILLQSGHTEPALALLRGRFQAQQLDLDSSLRFIRILRTLNRNEDALLVLREMARRWPDSGDVRFYLGDTLAVNGDLAGAENAFREALRLEPRQADFCIGLIRILATRDPRALTAAHPDSTQLAVRREMGRLADKASGLIGEDQRQDHLILGYAFRGAGALERAARHFEIAAQGSADRREAYLQLAICRDEMDQPDLAHEVLETLRREFPNDPTVANSLGYFLADKGWELERAEALIQQALADEPDNGAYLDSLGWVYFRQGRFTDAFDLLVKAANALPDDPTILEHLGLTLRELGKNEEALRVLRRAIAAGADAGALEAVMRALSAQE